ncbi:hypothetical protein AKJ50_01045, partial [candidate division MSBL1 archaeon SCGC-AAA382A13]
MKLSIGERAGFFGAILVVVGCFLPWMKINATSMLNGFETIPGIIAIIITVTVSVLIYHRKWDIKNALTLVVSGSIISILMAAQYTNPSRFDPELIVLMVEPSLGLYITLLGSVSLVFGGLFDLYFEEADGIGTELTYSVSSSLRTMTSAFCPMYFLGTFAR